MLDRIDQHVEVPAVAYKERCANDTGSSSQEDDFDSMDVHPAGDLELLGGGPRASSPLDTYGGRFHVE